MPIQNLAADPARLDKARLQALAGLAVPRSAGRLLTAMFASDDTCQQSLEALLDASGVSRPTIQSVLRTLLAAGVIAKEEKGHGQHANRYRLHLSLGIGA